MVDIITNAHVKEAVVDTFTSIELSQAVAIRHTGMGALLVARLALPSALGNAQLKDEIVAITTSPRLPLFLGTHRVAIGQTSNRAISLENVASIVASCPARPPLCAKFQETLSCTFENSRPFVREEEKCCFQASSLRLLSHFGLGV